ncbi:probable CDP-diacylglycerol--inositol 3-phosphatidyltransferase 2 [Zingiber officinale]|uniref:probable CDP-diacylglycerol--inositol 3-phosphatidyltransferase 2 n=1 Tax=Zingiber officinale TaxID=94328 RepID=UPI001C4CDF95|nr:probable CDP-diacylglycerol--inositol 3-phosphatidyltransferase 2 [Zingiber officinale]
MAGPSNQEAISVYLYVPNVIGYIRVILNCVAFLVCYSHKSLFAILYVTSFVCDALDGWFARRLNQVSTFGAVFDMVTDRVSTACLLSLLSQLYRPGLIFLALLGLDIGSHWLQMYSSFLSGKTSHKDVKDSSSWLFKLYYGNRLFMGFCCVGSEVLYVILYLLAGEKSESLISVYLNALRMNTLLSLLLLLVSIGWAIKQVVNVIQMKSAADSCVNHDTKRNV